MVQFKLSKLTLAEIEKIKCERRDLIELFVSHNQCENSESILFGKKTKRHLIHLIVRLGLNYSSLSFEKFGSSQESTDFENKTTWRLGMEVEFILPFYKNKWSLFAEPTYQFYNSTAIFNNKILTIDYQSIELPLGIRHYFYLNNDSKIFLNTGFTFDFKFNSNIDYIVLGEELPVSSVGNLMTGAGYNYKDIFNVEFRYSIRRELLNNYGSLKASYSSLSIILGYYLH